MVYVCYWCVPLQVECFGTLRICKIQDPFLSFWLYHVTLRNFFQIIFIFLQIFKILKM